MAACPQQRADVLAPGEHVAFAAQSHEVEWAGLTSEPELLAPLIQRAATGRPRVADRQVINGMVYKIRTGISWRDLPEHYGPVEDGFYTRFRRYALDGVFTGFAADPEIDSTIVRAHQRAAATGRRGGYTGVQNEQDPAQGIPIRHPRTTCAALPIGTQRGKPTVA
ncbi:transposase [Streptomyces sp. NBC_00259]|uniref:transposase n=1 Tax=Streptomyces sp. NBC_00259 TaxID=2903643 RepID=UPI002E2A5B44|nr:transposase [Streptomyces sp. NBC_00259]